MRDKSINVLLIEDSLFATRHTQKMLAEAQSDHFRTEVECADRLSTGVERLAKGGIDLVLLDLTLPDSNELDTFTRIRTQAPEVPIVVMSGLGDETLAIEAVNKGAQDYLVKGQVDGNLLKRSILYAIERNRVEKELNKYRGHLEELVEQRAATIVQTNLELQAEIAMRKQTERELQRSYHKLRETLIATVKVLASTIEMRDPYTAGHQRRVTILACAIAEEMDLTEEQFDGLRLAGLIHDIGKINVPIEILNKPGRISDTEFKIIKTHPGTGCNVLKEIEFPWPVAQIVLEHHERLDGSGYPQGLKDGKILLEAKILGVADVVEAMASNRPYRPALGLEVALAEITKKSGVLYDPAVVDACQRLFREKGFTFG